MVVIEVSDFIPLATIVGACSAPTLAAIWAGRAANRSADVAATKVHEVKQELARVGDATSTKLDTIHVLVNNQLTQAVERFNAATAEIEELKVLLKESHQRESKRTNGQI